MLGFWPASMRRMSSMSMENLTHCGQGRRWNMGILVHFDRQQAPNHIHYLQSWRERPSWLREAFTRFMIQSLTKPQRPYRQNNIWHVSAAGGVHRRKKKNGTVPFRLHQTKSITLVSTPFLRTPPKAYGGLELVVADWGRELAKRHYDATVFATDQMVPILHIHRGGINWPPYADKS